MNNDPDISPTSAFPSKVSIPTSYKSRMGKIEKLRSQKNHLERIAKMLKDEVDYLGTLIESLDGA